MKPKKAVSAQQTEDHQYDLTDQSGAIGFIRGEMRKAIEKVCEANGITIDALDKEVKTYAGGELYIDGFAAEYGITATQDKKKWRTN